MSTTATAASTIDPWVVHAIRTDRWDRVRALAIVLFGMLVWTVAWAGGAAAVATIAVGALCVVAVDVYARQVRIHGPSGT